jgi:signal transduction histidine kinase
MARVSRSNADTSREKGGPSRTNGGPAMDEEVTAASLDRRQLLDALLELEERVAERTAELEASTVKLVELTNQLREADRRKDEFLALLAHELRNPLAPVRNAVEIMRHKGSDDPDLIWCYDVIERQANHLTRLVDDLLDVSRITQGKIKLRLEATEIGAVVKGAVETSRPLIDSLKHKLVVRLPENPVWVRGDEVRLTQVVANLLVNAAKYQTEGGHIDLSVACEPGWVAITVSDRGIGIERELLTEVFDLFSQGERTADRRQGGLGIGLSVVKNLVEMHGGNVRVASAGRGHGSEFVVRLPHTAEATNGTGNHTAERISTPTGRARRILVVDDNRDAAEGLAALLRLRGHEVLVAHDGPMALDITATERPSVVLLDIGLPEMDGYEVCRRLRKQGLADAQIIAMTGYGQERDRQRSKEAGFNTHMVKPVNIGEIVTLLAAS